jgi:2-keto-3-deoxy-L-rhamnonate aldolase RhmA
VRDNGLKHSVAAGALVVGSTVTIADPFVTEVMGSSGVDFLIVDMEHAPITVTLLQSMLIALRDTPATVLVRLPGQDETAIKQVLDLGAEGLVVPSVDDRVQCEAVVAAARYGPIGRRGFGPRRASRLHGGRADYLKRANSEIVVLPMIESPEGVANIDEILQTPGLDGVMVGPMDLAVSMGYLHDPNNADVENAIDSVLTACQKHDRPFGIFTATREVAGKWAAKGARIVTVGSDVSYIDAGIARTKEALAELKSASA